MRPDAHHRLAGALLGLCLVCAPSARAQEPFLPVDAPVALGSDLLALAKGAKILSFGLVAAVDLPSVSAGEVLGGGAAVNLGTYTPGADVTGGIVLQTRLDRTVDTVWAAWIRDLEKVKNVSVQYEVIGARGSVGRLDADDPTAGAVSVEATPLTPRVLLRFGRWSYVVGGAVFTVDLTEARRAGRYSGRLRVSVFTL